MCDPLDGATGSVAGVSAGLIVGCHSTGAVTGSGNVGGLVGQNHDGLILNCYSTGSVSGTASWVGDWWGPIAARYPCATVLARSKV